MMIYFLIERKLMREKALLTKPYYLIIYIKEKIGRFSAIPQALPQRSSRERRCYSNTGDYAIFNPDARRGTYLPIYLLDARERGDRNGI